MILVDVDHPDKQPSTLYDLIANVTHESVAGTTRDKENTVWKVHLRVSSGENEKWLLIQDLIVEEVRKEMIFLGETVLQVSSLLICLSFFTGPSDMAEETGWLINVTCQSVALLSSTFTQLEQEVARQHSYMFFETING